MRSFLLLFLALGCARPLPPPPRAVSPHALAGVDIALRPVEDSRPSASTGCGQFAPDLPQKTEKALYVALEDAGAHVDRKGSWALSVRLLYGGAAAEYAGAQKAPPGPDEATRGGFGPSLGEARGGVNTSWEDTSVSLDAELTRETRVIWHGTAGGHVRSAPCVGLRNNLEQALSGAIADLRNRLVREIDRVR
ncbi:MAG: hypothetical protein ACJ78W_12820 [Myxococcales bacterium]